MQKVEEEVAVPAGKATIEGNLVIPAGAKGIALFAHGSGSGRFSPRNRYVAKVLNKAGIGTLLVDLLTKEEEEIDVATAEFRFNIGLLTQRLIGATEWLKRNPATKNLALGYFGASTGAAAALVAATKFPKDIKAVVSRGGRPDLAMEHLREVGAPTLFIVGGKDIAVLDLNKKAMEQIPAEKKLEIVSGATHLFEEPGKLEEVARLSADWFLAHFSQTPSHKFEGVLKNSRKVASSEF
ncbi:MAG TPA: dienelactone hydrolase family protein [Candidatus Bathyarchaeia archaeon]|nr:dienelactone hydrolase family protein [Candidatus Bathyarchaeia archaeon]